MSTRSDIERLERRAPSPPAGPVLLSVDDLADLARTTITTPTPDTTGRYSLEERKRSMQALGQALTEAIRCQ